MTDAKVRIDSDKDEDGAESVRERQKAGPALQEAGAVLKALRALRQEIATYWDMKEKCVFGELIWSPIVLSTEPRQYTQDLAVIKIDACVLQVGLIGSRSKREQRVADNGQPAYEFMRPDPPSCTD